MTSPTFCTSGHSNDPGMNFCGICAEPLNPIVLLLSAYRLLDLAPGAEESVVRAAYKAKSKRYHPDVGGSEAAFKELELALSMIEEAGYPTEREIGDAQRTFNVGPSDSSRQGAQIHTVNPPGPRFPATQRSGAPKSGLFRTWTPGEQWTLSVAVDVDTAFRWVLQVMDRAASAESPLRRAATGGLGVQIDGQDPNHTWIRFRLREGIDAGWLDVDLEPFPQETLTRWTLWKPAAEAGSKVTTRKIQARISDALDQIHAESEH